jgi:HEXXH motif-containing protein
VPTRFEIGDLPSYCFSDAVCGPSAAVWAGWARRALQQFGRLEAIVLSADRLGFHQLAEAAWRLRLSVELNGTQACNAADLGAWIQASTVTLDAGVPTGQRAALASSLRADSASLVDALIREAVELVRANECPSGIVAPNLAKWNPLVARVALPGVEYLPRADRRDAEMTLGLLAAGEAMALEALPWLAQDWRRLVSHIVPTEKQRGRLASGTNSDMLGAIFVTIHAEPGLVGEQMVHESAHTRLFLMQMLDDLCAEQIPNDSWTDANYYSPWRCDPRPLNGVLHGAFVFDAVAEYWRQLLARSILDGRATAVARRRLGLVVGQLEQAHATLEHHGRFTTAGMAVLVELRGRLNRLLLPTRESLHLGDELVLDIESIDCPTSPTTVNQYVECHRLRWEREHGRDVSAA